MYLLSRKILKKCPPSPSETCYILKIDSSREPKIGQWCRQKQCMELSVSLVAMQNIITARKSSGLSSKRLIACCSHPPIRQSLTCKGCSLSISSISFAFFRLLTMPCLFFHFSSIFFSERLLFLLLSSILVFFRESATALDGIGVVVGEIITFGAREWDTSSSRWLDTVSREC